MIRHELRHALRVLWRRPLPTLAIIATLALGIGVNTAIFTLVNAVLLQPFAVPEGERLVVVHQTLESLRTSPNPRLQSLWNRLPVTYLNTADWRDGSRSLDGIGLYSEGSVTLQGDGEPLAVDSASVDLELFRVLGVEAALGRTFTADEVEQGQRVVVLGHGVWQRLFGGDREILDTVVQLDGEPSTVVGVMPAGFDIPGGRDDRLWTPFALTDADRQARNNHRLSSLARLADGTSFEQASEELDRLAQSQAEAWPDTNTGTGVRLVPLLESVVGESRGLLWMLMAAVGAVLAIACVNVAHLLLVQAEGRRGELGIRMALGAGRGRLLRQLLLESLLPALAGGLLALPLAVLARRLLLAWLPTDLPRTAELPIDGRVLAFTLGASLLAALLCGLPPALTTSARAATERLRGGTDSGGGGRGLRFHNALVVAEIALTLVLTAGAGLLVNSFLRLSAVEPGFTTERLLVQDIRLPGWSYPDEPRRQAFAESLVERVGGLPGADAVALTSKLPFAGPALVAGFSIPGVESAQDGAGDTDWTQGLSASLKFVSPAYFDTLGIPLRRGRGFSEDDRPERGRVVVMNETLASRCWPGEDAVGRAIEFSDERYEVVGVVSDIRHDGLSEDPGTLMYFPWSQRGDLAALAEALTLVVSTRDDPLTLARSVRDLTREIDPSLPLPAATTVGTLMDESLGAPRGRTALVMLLAGLALVLALIGTYAVMSFAVKRRRPEIGVRMALGASAGAVRTLVLRRTLGLTLLGIALGLLGALAGGRLLEGLLWGVEATDPATLAVAALLLTVAAVAAGLFPALRASRVDPVSALRDE